MRFRGTTFNPNTGEEEEIDAEAFDETPDVKVKFNDDGSGSFIGLSSQSWNEYPSLDFYVGTAVLSDGTEIELSSIDLPEGIELVDETDDSDDLDDDDLLD